MLRFISAMNLTNLLHGIWAMCLLMVASACTTANPPTTAVDLLVQNARILTVDADFTIAQAMAVDDGRVVAVGDAALGQRYQARQILDLQGATVMPGFNDSHSHIHSYAPHYIALQKLTSIAAIKQAVAAMAQTLGPGAWITGYGWSEDQLSEQRRPLIADLDAAAPDNPVLLTRAGGHSAVANTLALARANIDTQTPQPDGGVIETDARGALNGIIRERQDLIADLIPEPTPEQVSESLRASLEELLPLGITSVTQASDQIERWPIWRSLYAEHGARLPRASVQMHWQGQETMRTFLAQAETNLDTSRLRLGAIKIFADGGFTGPAAFTKEPYRGETEYRGYLNMPEQALRDLIDEVHQAGWQMGIHAIGDAAIEITADALAQSIDANPRDDHRHYLNHFSMRPADATMQQMAAHGIAITQQPNFTYTLAGRYSTYLDGWRLEHNNPIRGPMEQGIFVALSSDILPIGPMVGLYAATTRRGMDGRVYGADEAITMQEAITAYTHGGAWLGFEEAQKGRLVPGMLADFIVLSSDPLATPAEAVMDIEVQQTWIGGQRVWSADDMPASVQ